MNITSLPGDTTVPSGMVVGCKGSTGCMDVGWRDGGRQPLPYSYIGLKGAYVEQGEEGEESKILLIVIL